MNLIIQILLILVLLDFLLYRHIKKFSISIINTKKKKPAKPKGVEEYEQKNPTIPPYILHFISGERNAWNLTRIAIYKMYLDGELLDYSSLIHGINEQLKSFTDQKLVDSLQAQLDYYIQESIAKPTLAADSGSAGENSGPTPPSAKPIDPIPPEEFS